MTASHEQLTNDSGRMPDTAFCVRRCFEDRRCAKRRAACGSVSRGWIEGETARCFVAFRAVIRDASRGFAPRVDARLHPAIVEVESGSGKDRRFVFFFNQREFDELHYPIL